MIWKDFFINSLIYKGIINQNKKYSIYDGNTEYILIKTAGINDDYDSNNKVITVDMQEVAVPLKEPTQGIGLNAPEQSAIKPEKGYFAPITSSEYQEFEPIENPQEMWNNFTQYYEKLKPLKTKELKEIVGSLSKTGKMPCNSFGVSAFTCNITCPFCYATIGHYKRFKATKEAQKKRIIQYYKNHNNGIWAAAMAHLIERNVARKEKKFRWFDAGDLHSESQLFWIFAINNFLNSKALIEGQEPIQFWLPTKRTEIIKHFTETMTGEQLTKQNMSEWPNALNRAIQSVGGISNNVVTQNINVRTSATNAFGIPMSMIRNRANIYNNLLQRNIPEKLLEKVDKNAKKKPEERQLDLSKSFLEPNIQISMQSSKSIPEVICPATYDKALDGACPPWCRACFDKNAKIIVYTAHGTAASDAYSKGIDVKKRFENEERQALYEESKTIKQSIKIQERRVKLLVEKENFLLDLKKQFEQSSSQGADVAALMKVIPDFESQNVQEFPERLTALLQKTQILLTKEFEKLSNMKQRQIEINLEMQKFTKKNSDAAQKDDADIIQGIEEI